jgi:hypothetical protein
MSVRALAVLATALGLAGAAAGRQHPDLSGDYKFDRAASEAASHGQDLAGWGRAVSHIEQRGGTFTVRTTTYRDVQPDTETVTVPTDGRAVAGAGGARPTTLSAAWSGDTLVITIRVLATDDHSVYTVRLSLQDGGRTLWMQRTESREEGTPREVVFVWRRVG